MHIKLQNVYLAFFTGFNNNMIIRKNTYVFLETLLTEKAYTNKASVKTQAKLPCADTKGAV